MKYNRTNLDIGGKKLTPSIIRGMDEDTLIILAERYGIEIPEYTSVLELRLFVYKELNKKVPSIIFD